MIVSSLLYGECPMVPIQQSGGLDAWTVLGRYLLLILERVKNLIYAYSFTKQDPNKHSVTLRYISKIVFIEGALRNVCNLQRIDAHLLFRTITFNDHALIRLLSRRHCNILFCNIEQTFSRFREQVWREHGCPKVNNTSRMSQINF